MSTHPSREVRSRLQINLVERTGAGEADRDTTLGKGGRLRNEIDGTTDNTRRCGETVSDDERQM